MNNLFNPQSGIAPSVLASDLDGTLIPLPNSAFNYDDLISIKEMLIESNASVVFATGRHFESVIEAIDQYDLPTPDWIVCDVGSAIYKRVLDGFECFDIYAAHLVEVAGGVNRQAIEDALASVDGLAMQPPDHQQQFKISYQSTSNSVNQLVDEINQRLNEANLSYDCMGSVDPFLNCGLIDVMPRGISKAYALLWLSTHANFHPNEVIYAGDSGNDLAALISGFRAIIVANSSEGLEGKVRASLAQRGLADRLYVAQSTASSGVLEGCRHFGLFA